GLKSVRETVNKYKGTMVIQTEDGWFELKLLFPVRHSMPKRG
ncbi:MAG: GHKL domain-containing protein, partial [Enterococcus sp.]|nr:GHKL domain-containing protein [Enterococcus sp.]